MKATMRLAAAALTLAGGMGLAAIAPTSAEAKPLKITLPQETATFKPGTNREAVMNNCTACHSADYIQTQPRGPKFKKDFWNA